MFPINDTEKNRYSLFSWMNFSIVFINTFIFFFISMPMMIDAAFSNNIREYAAFLYKFGSTPYLMVTQTGLGAISSVTSMFLHGSLSHWFFNMFALVVFGRRVEDALGPIRYLFFYLMCGVGADLCSTLIHWGDTIPSIGASGAIFGVMGAYLVLYPTGRIRTFFFIPGTPIPLWPKIRAFWVILYFLAIQIIPAYLIVSSGADYRVGYWAHLGGFFTALLVHFFLRPEAYARYVSDVDV
jgi:membrane associated rhomboid family serine protease